MSNIYGEDTITSSIPLAKYARIIGYSECAFWGVSHPDNARYACTEIWTKDMRDMMQTYLAEAEDEIEQIAGYPLTPKWIVGERHKYSDPVISKYGEVIEGGVKVETVIQDNAVVDLLTDPCTVTIVTADTEFEKWKIFYPGTDLEITPSNIQTVGPNVVISIPKCRLVGYAYLENPTYGWDYADNTYFQSPVDIHKIDNDPSTQGVIVWSHGCSSSCLSTGCSDYTKTACIIVESGEIGRLSLRPATWDPATLIWTSSSLSSYCCRHCPDYLELNYHAGLSKLSRIAETAIVRLAHSKAPTEPCGCDITQRLWKRDRNIPVVLTRERLECPFGLSDGAWMAWKFASSISLEKMSIL